MEWRDEAIVLASRPYGESAALVSLLTREHGRHAGLARGASGRGGPGTGSRQPGGRGSASSSAASPASWSRRMADA